MPSRYSKFYFKIFFLAIAFAIFSFQLVHIAIADTADELKIKIADRNNAIAQLEAEIKSYQSQIDVVSKKANTLQNTLAELDLSKKKLEADLKITQNKISATNLEIQRLSLDIGAKQNNIEDDRTIIGQSLNKLFQSGNPTVLETLLQQNSLSSSLASVERLVYLQDGVRTKIHSLQTVKKSLETNKQQTESKKADLVVLTNQLKSQTKLIADTVAEKNAILKDTKNTEANYKKTLSVKQAQKDAFEKEVSNLESSLKFALDPTSIPPSGSGVLNWPLASPQITQYFGNTEFATKNPSVYKGTGHNGIDFRASVGTPVMAAASGVITQVINTNAAQRCGYGKWIVVKHSNGLSTLYAHLSLTATSIGSSVTTGQVIGYSGNTGFTTGPHLHFGVYVSEGLQTIESKSCPGIIIPYAAFNAYLNPLSFLPN